VSSRTVKPLGAAMGGTDAVGSPQPSRSAAATDSTEAMPFGKLMLPGRS
jgi:hypothetical protein